ncbi:MAG: prepilin-type N-terminal cleavage/methylation domain-containing protein [Bacilli bacterium]|nr:prepilin-type N-terminal cleavage/methylation domain-containing protein [Bacilli bacterium]
MNNKKGFTLIEIIICIGLIALIGTISVVTFTKLSDSNKEKDKYVQGVKDATSVFIERTKFESRRVKITEAGYLIQLKELVEEGLIKEETYNPFKEKSTSEVDYDCVKIYLDDNKNINVTYPVEECKNMDAEDIALHLEKRVNLDVTNNVVVDLLSSDKVFETYSNGGYIDFSLIQSGNINSQYYNHYDNASIFTLTPGSSLVTQEEIDEKVRPLLTSTGYIFVKEDVESGKLLKTSDFNDIENRKWTVKATYDFDNSKGYTIVDKNIVSDIVLNDNSAPFLLYTDYSEVSEHINELNSYSIEYFDNFEGWLSWDDAKNKDFIKVNEIERKIIVQDSSGNKTEYTFDSMFGDNIIKGEIQPKADQMCYSNLDGFIFSYSGDSMPLSEALYYGMVEYKDGKMEWLEEDGSKGSMDIIYDPPKLIGVTKKSGEVLGITTFSTSDSNDLINGAYLYYTHSMTDHDIFINNYNKFIVHKSGSDLVPITDYDFSMYVTDFNKSSVNENDGDYLIGTYTANKKATQVTCSDGFSKEELDGGVLCYNNMDKVYDQSKYIVLDFPNVSCASNMVFNFNLNDSSMASCDSISCHLETLNYINSLPGGSIEDKETIISGYISSHNLEDENIVEVDGKYWISAMDN